MLVRRWPHLVHTCGMAALSVPNGCLINLDVFVTPRGVWRNGVPPSVAAPNRPATSGVGVCRLGGVGMKSERHVPKDAGNARLLFASNRRTTKEQIIWVSEPVFFSWPSAPY